MGLALGCGVAAAQVEQGTIVVSVVDIKDLSPIADTKILLFGQIVSNALTGHDGRIRFADVPAGLYKIRATRGGYETGVSDEFSVTSGKLVSVNIALAARLATIGKVKARTSVSINSADLSDGNPLRKISETLPDALDKLSGVNVRRDSNSPDSPLTVSLRNHDETQTSVTIDGVPVNAPGVATDLRSFNTDLFTGASVDFRPSAAGLGGSINFNTLQPTPNWQEHAQLSYGNYDHSTYDLGLTGTLGRLGVAAEHTWRGTATAVTGSVFIDQSGVDYAHGGETVDIGDLFKLRYRLGDRTTLTGSTLISNRGISPLCTADVTHVPCGIGPGNAETGRNIFGYASVLSLIGDAAVQFTGFTSTSTFNTNEIPRQFNQFNVPLIALHKTISHGLAFSSTLGVGHHTFTFDGSEYDSSTLFNVFDKSPFVTPSRYDEHASSIELDDAFKINDRLSLSGQLSSSTATGSGPSTLGGIGATWHPSEADTLTFNAAQGSAQPAQSTNRTFTDPVSARYDCQAGTVFVDGPGDDPIKQTSTSYDLGWSHRLRAGQVNLDLYAQRQLGQSITAAIPAALEPPGYFPNGYLDSLTGVWSFPVICGSSPFAPAGVYVNQLVSGSGRLYRGFDLSARLAVGPYVTISPAYATAAAVFQSGDSRLTGPASTTILGAQLPERPLHKGGITIDGIIPHSGTEWIVNGQWVSDNNNRHLGNYFIANIGLSQNTRRGQLHLYVNNLFNNVAGVFSTLHAQPIATTSGPSIAIAAIPVAPRQWIFSYSMSAGNSRARKLPAPPMPHAYTFGPAPAQGDPLALAADRPACDAQARPIAQQFLDGLRAYVREYNAGGAPSGLPGVDVTLHETPDLSAPWWVELHFKDESRYARATDCTYVALYTRSEAKKAKIGYADEKTPPLSFAPGIGFYVVGPGSAAASKP